VRSLNFLCGLFTDASAPSSVRILPGEPIVFSGCADYFLRILVDHRSVMLFVGIIVLSFDVPATNVYGVQFVAADTTVQDLLRAGFCVEVPFSRLLNKRHWKWPILVADIQVGSRLDPGIHLNLLLSLR